MIKSVIGLFLLIVLAGCSPDPGIVQEHMVIAPATVVFGPNHSDTTVSITHTCTCPFFWSDTIHHVVPWLVLGQNFSTGMTSDHPSIPLSIDRTKLTLATDTTVIVIRSNAYGVDSLTVIAIQ